MTDDSLHRPAAWRSATRRIALVAHDHKKHDLREKALMRIAVVWNIPIACNRASADLLITSPLLTHDPEFSAATA
jgi:methylglyoxal synthase